MGIGKNKAIARPGAAGPVTVEFAFVAIIFFSMLFSILEYGRFIMFRHILDNAVRQGARQAAADASFKVLTPGVPASAGPPPVPATSATYTGQSLTTLDIQTTVFNSFYGQVPLASAGVPLALANCGPNGPGQSGTFIVVKRVPPVPEKAFPPNPTDDWTQASFGESISVTLNVKYQPMLPGWHYLTNPTTILFTCVMKSEASH